METLNLTEILVANSAAVVLLCFLLQVRIRRRGIMQIGEHLFTGMIWLALTANVFEVFSFVIDGKAGMLMRILQYLSNAVLFWVPVSLGYLWCLYVVARTYQSSAKLWHYAKLLAAPWILETLLVILDLFGANLLFSITAENVYVRGRVVWICYVALFFYYIYSMIFTWHTKRKGVSPHFFPVFAFLLPCITGTAIQWAFYGITVGWLGAAIALVFLYILLQTKDVFVDELSGLYNRSYFDHYMLQAKEHRQQRLCGIMIDVNGFKKINDSFGHATGDDAIRTIGKILSDSAEKKDLAIRFAGDEFILLAVNTDMEGLKGRIERIEAQVRRLNESGEKPYQLSLAMGYSEYRADECTPEDFLQEIDQKMYAAKNQYYRTFGDRRKKPEASAQEAKI